MMQGSSQKKIETHWKIVEGSRKAFWDSDDMVGSHRKFARRFTEGIEKHVGNTKGDLQEKDRRTYCKNAGGYQIMRELGLN
ncbi:hypothetical protein B296_00054213 [Ensete ventricosum]|uniref:Uncharacterized protein n=1 Tax=Ensete ventricosum TaxID=4639 RepID=A0A426WVX5_ENSVE|nr:hypothetical protein B296_00054213 [Ensete ventricosum]